MVTTFHTTPRMPTYLVALAICDFDHVSRTERGKEVSSEGPPRTQGAMCCLYVAQLLYHITYYRAPLPPAKSHGNVASWNGMPQAGYGSIH